MKPQFRGLATLEALSEADITALRRLGIDNLGDLLAYSPFRYAAMIRAANDGLLRDEEVQPYLDETYRNRCPAEWLEAPVQALRGLGEAGARQLNQLGLQTIGDLAAYPAYAEAEELLSEPLHDESDPFAPACVLPRCRKYTRNSKHFISFFRDRELRELSVLHKNPGSAIANLFHLSTLACGIIHLGYSVSYRQEWIYTGVHLGEPLGSASLLMGQDTQISVLDWKRMQTALRRERSDVSERLLHTVHHQRAVDEVARATAEEHQHGSTSAFGANAATAGSFVAGGALIGGVGGGVSGALAGLVIGNAANAAGGAPTLAGAAVGTAVGGAAGAAAGSLVYAGAVTMGFVETDAEGDRSIYARSAQNIQQRTVQNSSSIRSFWSNIVSQSVEDERQRVRTDRVTNYNRIHALNALYFEVLNAYRVTMQANGYTPVLFLPYKPFSFDEQLLRRYWWILRSYFADKLLVKALDEHFSTLTSVSSPGAQLEDLPQIDSVRSAFTEIELDLDGSAVRSLIEAKLIAIFGLAGGPLSAAVAAFFAAFRALFDATKRENIEVELIAAGGSIALSRTQSPNSSFISNPDFVGIYSTPAFIPVHSIEGFRIRNRNSALVLSAFGLGEIDLTELAFERAEARLTVANKSALLGALPSIGALEVKRSIGEAFTIGSNSAHTIAWDVADRLRNQFEGIHAEAEELEAALAHEASVQTRIINLLGFLNANRYGFTRLILQNVEREQLMCALEQVEVAGVDLNQIAGTIPIGFSGNHVVLPLKKHTGLSDNVGALTLDTSKLELELSRVHQLARDDLPSVQWFANGLFSFLEQFIPAARNQRPLSSRDQQLLQRLGALRAQAVGVQGLLGVPSRDRSDPSARPVPAHFAALVSSLVASVHDVLAFLDVPVHAEIGETAVLKGYFSEVSAALDKSLQRIIASDDISLPSPAVFMEPVLSNAKGAELYDMRRNSHYEIMPSPGIGDVDPNTLRAREMAQNPTVPGSALDIQPGPDWALPETIKAAMAEVGKLSLDALITSNAETLGKTLDSLSSLATELAKASAQLTGEAQKQAMDAASNVTKQMGEIVKHSLNGQSSKAAAKPSESAKSSAPTVAPNPVPPPRTQQQKSEVGRELRRIDESQAPDAQKIERKQALGVPVQPPGQHDYRMAIVFLDELGRPYPEGHFRLTMTFLEHGISVAFDGGQPIAMQDGVYLYPQLMTLHSGRKATISISAEIAGVAIDGLHEFILPAEPDLLFQARMLHEVRRVSATNATRAMEQAVQSSSFGVGLDVLLERYLNAGVAFPFKIFRINAEAGGKTELDLRGEYASAQSNASTTVEDSTVTTEYEVILPRNGWTVELV